MFSKNTKEYMMTNFGISKSNASDSFYEPRQGFEIKEMVVVNNIEIEGALRNLFEFGIKIVHIESA